MYSPQNDAIQKHLEEQTVILNHICSDIRPNDALQAPMNQNCYTEQLMNIFICYTKHI